MAEAQPFNDEHVFSPVVERVSRAIDKEVMDCGEITVALAQQCGFSDLGIIELIALIDAALFQSELVINQGSWTNVNERPDIVGKWYQAENAFLEVIVRDAGDGSNAVVFGEYTEP